MNKISKEKLIRFFSGILFLFLFIPSVTHGYALDPLQVILKGTSDQVGPFFAIFAVCSFIFVLGYLALFATTFFLQQAIEITPEALTVLSGETSTIVNSGWSFVVGIANMGLIIGFIAIAIAIIFGSEKLGLKKALPSLVIVALLMNFTLLFVGIGIDISNFLFNSIGIEFAKEGGNLLWEALEPFFNLNSTILIDIGAITAGLFAANLTIVGTIAVQAIMGLTLLAFLPLVLQVLIVGLISLSLAGIFFIFFFVLIARIFVVQFLAILAPAAFFCLIFPSTKKWWDLWLEHLVQWLFAGVALIFLMYLGLVLAPSIENFSEPLTDAIDTPILGWWVEGVLKYIILFIYFAVILGIARKFIPELANAAITHVKNGIQTISPYARTVGGKLSERYKMHLRGQIKKDPNLKEKMERDLTAAPPPDTKWFRPDEQIKAFYKRSRARAALGEPIEEGKRKLKEEEEDLKGKSDADYINSFVSALEKKDFSKALGALLAGKKNGVNVDVEAKPHYEKYRKDLETEADLLGKGKDFNKINWKEFLKEKNKGKGLPQQEANRKDMIVSLNKNDIEMITKSIIAAAKDTSDKSGQAEALGMLKQFLMAGKNSTKSFVGKGGKDAIELYRKTIAKEKEVNSERGNILEKRFVNSIKGTPGEVFLTEEERKKQTKENISSESNNENEEG